MSVPTEESIEFYRKIFRAIEEGDINKVSIMLDGDLDQSIGVMHMDTPLLYAIRNNLIESIESLIEKGANINYQDDESPLECAILEGSKEAVEILLKNGVEIHFRNSDGATPLHFATLSNDAEKLDLILPFFKSDINVIDICFQSALMYAAYADADMSATKLVEYGADMDLFNSYGLDALMISSMCNSPKVANILIKSGAGINYTVRNDFTDIPKLTHDQWRSIINYFPDVNKKYKFQFLRTINNRRYLDLILMMLCYINTYKQETKKEDLYVFLGETGDDLKYLLTFFEKLTRKNRIEKIINVLRFEKCYQIITHDDMRILKDLLLGDSEEL